jgi:hypothetical protein
MTTTELVSILTLIATVAGWFYTSYTQRKILERTAFLDREGRQYEIDIPRKLSQLNQFQGWLLSINRVATEYYYTQTALSSNPLNAWDLRQKVEGLTGEWAQLSKDIQHYYSVSDAVWQKLFIQGEGRFAEQIAGYITNVDLLLNDFDRFLSGGDLSQVTEPYYGLVSAIEEISTRSTQQN